MESGRHLSFRTLPVLSAPSSSLLSRAHYYGTSSPRGQSYTLDLFDLERGSMIADSVVQSPKFTHGNVITPHHTRQTTPLAPYPSRTVPIQPLKCHSRLIALVDSTDIYRLYSLITLQARYPYMDRSRFTRFERVTRWRCGPWGRVKLVDGGSTTAGCPMVLYLFRGGPLHLALFLFNPLGKASSG